jgi:REP element-mobilizing transposase RayT
MILAHHSIFSMYGFWLPNDPRGSGSDYIAVWELFRYGHATKVDTRHSVAADPHDGTLRQAAKLALRHPPVQITGEQALAIVAGFTQATKEADYRVHACAVLPDHVHFVIGAHPRNIRTIVGHFKSRATRALKQQGLWPADNRPVWGDHGWNVWLEDAAAVARAIRYVNENPLKEGKRPQRWSFVTPFDLHLATQIALGPKSPRRIGGAALRSHRAAQARRQRPRLNHDP